MMDRGWYFRFSVVVVAVVLAWFALWPSLSTWVPAPSWVGKIFAGKISPGLDIKGGLRLMYEVEVEEAIGYQRDRMAESLLERLGEQIGLLDGEETPTRKELEAVRKRISIDRQGLRDIIVKFDKSDDIAKLNRDFLREYFPDLRIVQSAGGRVALTVREERLEELRKNAVAQVERVIKNRIDELQIRETTVIGRETDIIIEVPGADESMFDRIRAIISRTARLEFKLLDEEGDFVANLTDLPEGITPATEMVQTGPNEPETPSTYLLATGPGSGQKLKEYVDSLSAPPDRQLAMGRVEGGGPEGEERWRTYYLFDTAAVTGEDIKDAFVSYDSQQSNQPVVLLHFNSKGAEEFERVTGRNVARRFAVVLDDRVESAPRINERIGGGRAQITLGRGSYRELLEEAKDLALVLRAGALPAPITPANEQLIGPTLGRDSILQGAEGALVSIGLVLLFMLFYYHVAGAIADLMVICNVLFLLAILSGFEATLTLPGVAGIALTVGMAVDANVLITERIREELRLGKSARSAVDQGFRRAFWSIFDSQFTTFIAGVVLFQYGTGPIKGFAVTLMFGIATSLFTGVFCSRVCFDWLVRGLRVQRLRVG